MSGASFNDEPQPTEPAREIAPVDIVVRLVKEAATLGTYPEDAELFTEAADEIDRLRGDAVRTSYIWQWFHENTATWFDHDPEYDIEALARACPPGRFNAVPHGYRLRLVERIRIDRVLP